MGKKKKSNIFNISPGFSNLCHLPNDSHCTKIQEIDETGKVLI